MPKQRIRDPVHDLIEFDGPEHSQLEGVLWKVLQTRPFQRLRRIRQLGLSDLVYPGASHSRFAHSVGVFHTARQLMEIVRRHTSSRQDTRENHALAAALVHDLGHGPFSHAFEKVGKRLSLKLANHEVMSEELIRGGEVSNVLNEMGRCFADDVADIIRKDGIKTVHHAVVSSQFDADRLDYIRRDRMMTGSQHAGIDFRWLLANLEIGEVQRGVDGTRIQPVETFVLGPKAVHAAEAYVLGLFQLYPTVYFHKATRGAEKILEELLVRIVGFVRNDSIEKTGLPKSHPLVRFAQSPDNVDVALSLDDSVVWGSLSLLAETSDCLISQYAKRLRDRQLLKCYDIRTEIAHEFDPERRSPDDAIEKIDRCCALVNQKLSEWAASFSSAGVPRGLIDQDERTPYNSIDRSNGPLDRINVKTEGGILVDLAERSAVVSALKKFKLHRVYFDRSDANAQSEIHQMIKEEIANVKKLG